MVPTDLKQEKPPNLSPAELRKWAYQVYAKDYLRCVAGVDESVGRLLKFLDEEKLADETLVFYTSDQGFFVGEHGYYDKRFMYEPSLRTPLVARLPGRVKPSSVNRDLVLNIDFAETFLELAGLPIPTDMQGRGLLPLLEGRTPADWRKSMYYRYWMHLADHGVPAHYGVRTERYKLIHFYGQALGTRGSIDRPTADEWELFDLEKDPQELRNLYDDPEHAEVVKQLKAELARLRRELKDER
jgi:arylsulfatase A-like enzyme